MVGEGGFEPPKSVTTDLQSAPFGHSGIPPYKASVTIPRSPRLVKRIVAFLVEKLGEADGGMGRATHSLSPKRGGSWLDTTLSLWYKI